MECAHSMANVLMCLNIFFMFVIGSFSFISRLLINGICVVALVLDVKTMSGATFYPHVMMLLTSIDTLCLS